MVMVLVNIKVMLVDFIKAWIWCWCPTPTLHFWLTFLYPFLYISAPPLSLDASYIRTFYFFYPSFYIFESNSSCFLIGMIDFRKVVYGAHWVRKGASWFWSWCSVSIFLHSFFFWSRWMSSIFIETEDPLLWFYWVYPLPILRCFSLIYGFPIRLQLLPYPIDLPICLLLIWFHRIYLPINF